MYFMKICSMTEIQYPPPVPMDQQPLILTTGKILNPHLLKSPKDTCHRLPFSGICERSAFYLNIFSCHVA